MSAVTTQHIAIDEHTCFGKPRVAGTRITVWQIYQLHEVEGRSAEEIEESYPPLTKAGIYAALAYYYDHKQEIDARNEEGERFVEEYITKYGRGPLQEKLQKYRESK